MDGRAFLDVARRLAGEPTEADWRTAVGRAYYALLLEGKALLGRWGFPSPPRHQVHRFVRLCFIYAGDADLKKVGFALEDLVLWRNQADYEPEKPGRFTSASIVHTAVARADVAIRLLDQIDADPVRRAAAIEAITPPP